MGGVCEALAARRLWCSLSLALPWRLLNLQVPPVVPGPTLGKPESQRGHLPPGSQMLGPAMPPGLRAAPTPPTA